MRKVNALISCIFLLLFNFKSYAQTLYKDNSSENKTITTKTPAKVEEKNPISGYLNFTSNYIFRGVSSSDNQPAVQGSLTYTFLSNGIYLNVFSSSTHLIAPNGDLATIELDPLIGISNDIGEHFNYNLSFAHYHYPQAKQLNYNELIAVATYYYFIGTLAYSANEFGLHAPGTYYNLAVKLPVTFQGLEGVNFLAAIGHFQLPEEVGNSYDDYSITLSKEIKNFVIALQWTDTNHKLYNNKWDHAFIIGSLTVNI